MLAPRLLEGLKVLVVEDNLLLAEVTKILLEDRRDGCRAASNWRGTSRSTGRSSTSTSTAR